MKIEGKKVNSQKSPIRGPNGKAPDNVDPHLISREYYETNAKEATKQLTKFLSLVLPAKTISVVYFDEAHELEMQLWILLRLVQHQPRSTKMWYAFLGTKLSLFHYAPPPNECQSAPSLACS